MALGFFSLREVFFFFTAFALICMNFMVVSGGRSVIMEARRWMEEAMDYADPHPNPGHDPKFPPPAPQTP